MHAHTKPKIHLPRRRFMLSAAAFGAVGSLGFPFQVLSQNNRVLRARLYNDINRLDPAIYENAYNVEVMNLIYPKLVGYRHNSSDWDWQLEAAESMEQIDATHIRFRLRPGLMWTGGHGEVTAEDVKYSYERCIDPEIDSPVKGDWGPLSHVEVEDTYTGVIVLDEPFQPLWTIALPYGVGHIVSKSAVEARGGGRFGMESTAFAGPYQLREWQANQVVIIERNPEWTGEEPAFDEIRIHPIADPQAGELAFEAGDIDYTQPGVASLERYRVAAPAGSQVEEFPALFYVWVGMNTEHPKLQDPRVRQAVQWAINVPQVLDAAYFGIAETATGIIAPGLAGHRAETLVPPEGDVERARELLREAGAEGIELRMDVRNTATFSTAAQVIQAQCRQAGINLEVRLLESGVFWTIGSEAEGDQWQDLQLVLNRFSSTPDPYYATQWFTTEQVGRWNWERFSNEEYDTLHMEAVRELDGEKRSQMYRRMQDIMEESGAYRFITHEVNAIMYRDHLAPAVRPDGISLYNHFDQS